MPINYKEYAPNWKALSKQVREEANQQCEWCAAPNGQWIKRLTKPDQYRQISVNGIIKQVPYKDFEVAFSFLLLDSPRIAAAHEKEIRSLGLTKIILTVAHLDRDKNNNARSNLAALCQRCHLGHDRVAQHIPNRKYGRRHKRALQTTLEL